MKNHGQKDFNLFFLTGKDRRLLNQNQQKQILSFLTKEKHSSSLFIYNSNETIRKYRFWKERLPWIKVYYAVKANPNKQILQDLINQGSNFDCASKNQIQLLLSLGAKPEQIIYSNTIKQQSHLQLANNLGIKLTTADTFQQLQKIQEFAPKIQILWRISIIQQKSDQLSSHFSGKFGDDLTNKEEILQTMQKIHSMGINLKGIHFHCGSGHHGASGFGKGISLARQCIKIGRQCGHDMKILDIGGGYPGGQFSEKLINVLKTTQNDPLNYQVFSEPGQNLCSTSFYLLTKVLSKKTKNNQTNYYLNESNYHSFYLNTLDVNNLWYANHFYSCLNSKSKQSQKIKETQISTLFGMTSDEKDVIASNISVPINLNISDWLCISAMGAYYYSAKSSFSGLQAGDKILTWNASFENNQKLQTNLQPCLKNKQKQHK